MYLQSPRNFYHHPLRWLQWHMLPPPSLPLQLTSVSWLIADCSREHHFFNKCTIRNWLPSLLISSSCFFKIISFNDLPPSHPRRSISPTHDSGGTLTAPVGPNADPLAPWFWRNYAGINDGSPRMYFSTFSAEPSGRGPEAQQSLCRCSAGGRVCFAKVYAGRQRDLVFLFRGNYETTTHSHFFPLRLVNRNGAITCHRLKNVYTLSFLRL